LVLEDVRKYVEQLAYSLDSINAYHGAAITFSAYNRNRIRETLRLDDLIEEIRRISEYLEDKRDHEYFQPIDSNGLSQRELDVQAQASAEKSRQISLTFLPTRGPIMELLGSNSATCIRRLVNIARTYDEATAVAFVIDDGCPRLMGGSLVFTGRLGGQPVLVIRSFNPVYELLDRINTSEIFEKFTDYVLEVARAGGFSAVTIPHADFWHNAGSVRAPVFFHMNKKYANLPVEQLDDSQVVNFNGLSSRNVVVIRR
jgi:hypothetical protein